MNRQIKFRAWDELNQEMVYEKTGIFSGGKSSWEILRLYENVMQFTGLHDKNGKEIYEGDIVTDGVGKYKIIYDLKLAGYQPYCIFRDEPENYCEVIGNLYENPELLESSGEK